MNSDDVLAAEDRFLRALVRGDTALLRAMLTDDFVMVDPISNSETPKDIFLEALGSGALGFPTLKRTEAKVSIDDTTARVTGSAYMQVRLGSETLTMSSRYIHIFMWQDDSFKVVSAQATSVPGGVK